MAPSRAVAVEVMAAHASAGDVIKSVFVSTSFVGMPFFYWFQLALVFISAAVTAVVYWATE
jgi:hypothetical protein